MTYNVPRIGEVAEGNLGEAEGGTAYSLLGVVSDIPTKVEKMYMEVHFLLSDHFLRIIINESLSFISLYSIYSSITKCPFIFSISSR